MITDIYNNEWKYKGKENRIIRTEILSFHVKLVQFGKECFGI